jgi:hypothetical protein
LGWAANLVNRKEVEAQKNEWDFYFSNVNDVLSSLMVNLSAIRRTPDPAKSWLLWVWVHLLDARHDGLSSETEAPMLFKIEDRLSEALSAACGAELLGRITGDRRREFYFYAATPDGFDNAVKSAKANFAGYRVEWGKQPDPEWRQYRNVLYPAPGQLRDIQNRRVLDRLLEMGDDHAIARMVDHTIYFRPAAARAAYASKAVKLGFGISTRA